MSGSRLRRPRRAVYRGDPMSPRPPIARAPAAPVRRRRPAALARGRAVGPRRDPALGPHALRARHRGGRCSPRTSTASATASIYESMLALYADERADRRPHGHRAPALARQARGGRRPAPRSTRSPAPRRPPATLRHYGADRPRARAPAPPAHDDLRDPGRGPQPRRRCRATSSSRPSGRCSRSPTTTARRTSARSATSSHAEIDKWQQLSTEGSRAHRHAVGLRRPRRDHRRLPARQPDHPRRAPVDGQVRARHEHRRERRARTRTDPRPVALFSLEMSEAELAQRFIASQASIKGDDLRKGRLKDERKWKRVLDVAGELRRRAAVRRRLVRHRHPRDPREGAPAAPAVGARRPRPDHRRLPAAHARRRAHREPRRSRSAR